MGKCKIAILDSGLDEIFLEQNNVVFEDDVIDHNGHGTMCYSLINFLSQNTNTEFYIRKILDKNLLATSETLLYELRRIVNQDINVINLSLSTNNFRYKRDLQDVCNRLRSKGKLLIASQDNNVKNCSLPSEFSSVIGVGGGIYNSNSSFCYKQKRKIQASCNSVPVLLKGKDGDYSFFGGTSKAAACMTGIIASHWENISLRMKENKVEEFLEELSKKSTKKTLNLIDDRVYFFVKKELMPEIANGINEKRICKILGKFEKEFNVHIEYEKLLLLDFYDVNSISWKLSQLLI